MTGRAHFRPLRWLRDTSGGVLVEFAVVIALFSFLFYTLMDFGRLSHDKVLAENAAYLAARTAIVRPPACAGVPDTHERGTVPAGTPPPVFGTSCSAASYVCTPVATITCNGVATNPTALEIWNNINPMLPANAAINHLQFTYSFDSNLGFLGGPYTPMVTVQFNLPDFQFISPLGALAAAAGGSGLGTMATFAHPSYSVSLPAEDLNIGEAG